MGDYERMRADYERMRDAERDKIIAEWKAANGYDDLLNAYSDATARIQALERGAAQSRLLSALPLPLNVVAVVVAARRVVDAADACDREAERHPSSRSSAPVVRAINAMTALRAALADVGKAEVRDG